LLIGILLHKAPAAFALVALFKSTGMKTNKTIFFLVLFSLMSPLGLVLGEYLLNFSIQSVLLLFAIVSGGFLHISTTIFVESSPNHSFKFDRQIVSLAGALFAVLAEFLM
jgi:zinc transporter ZupT